MELIIRTRWEWPDLAAVVWRMSADEDEAFEA